MPADEAWNKRLMPVFKFGETYCQPCLSGCGQTLIIDGLQDGDIWACTNCEARHEFYTEVASGPGGHLKYGVVRLLIGKHERSKGEPSITEFVEK